MKLTIKLFATLRDGRGKVLENEYSPDTTPRDILDSLNIRETDVAILLRNGVDCDLDESLEDGDTLSVFPPVGGG